MNHSFGMAIRIWFAISIVLVFAASPADSPRQADKAIKGAIAGTVTTDAGEPAKGAKVICFNLDTGETAEATTDPKGDYKLDNLPIGDYEVSVFNDGFDVYQSPELKVGAGETMRHDIKLEQLRRPAEAQ